MPGRINFSLQEKERIIEMYNSEIGSTTIARRMGVSEGTILRRLKEWGIFTPRTGRFRDIRFSNKEREKIVLGYYSGDRIENIAEEYGTTHQTIYNRLREWGVAPPNGRMPSLHTRIATYNKDKIIKLFYDYKTYEQIADELEVSASAISECIKDWGLKRSEYLMRSLPQRKYVVDSSCFDELSEESLYWGGFLLADGNVYRRDGSDIFQMSLKDREHLEKFLDFIGSNHPIRLRKKGKHRIFKIRISRLALCRKLRRFGVVPRKSKIHTVPMVNNIAYNRDFWRGVFDGDGSLFHTSRGYWHMSLVSGCYSLVWQFVRFLKYHGLGDNKIVKYKNMPKWQYTKTGRGTRNVAALLYQGANVSLDRKKAAADKIMEKHASR